MNNRKKEISYLDLLKINSILNLSKILFLPSIIITQIFIFSALYLGLINAPTDYLQGEHYRILFIHVPSAWFSIFLYTLMTIFSVIYLITRHPLLSYFTNISSQFGILFTCITLVTGSMWGLPMWGTWWVWDARLTSVLVSLFLYMGYNIIYNSFKGTEKGSYYSSIMCIIGFVNIPIIKYSVDWWSTLHQPASITKIGSTIHVSMLYPLLLMTMGLMFFCISISMLLIRKRLIHNKINAIELKIN